MVKKAGGLLRTEGPDSEACEARAGAPRAVGYWRPGLRLSPEEGLGHCPQKKIEFNIHSYTFW